MRLPRAHFASKLNDYLLHRAFALLNESAFARLPSLRTCHGQAGEEPLVGEAHYAQSGFVRGAFVTSPSSYAMTQTASRAEHLVRRATDGPAQGDSFDSSP